jgi:hypothetical protein
VAPRLISDAQIARLNRAHDRMWAGEIDGEGFYYEGKRPDVDWTSRAVRKIQNGWWINDEFRVLVRSSVIGRVACALMGVPSCRLWHDQVIESLRVPAKPPRRWAMSDGTRITLTGSVPTPRTW